LFDVLGDCALDEEEKSASGTLANRAFDEQD
jgi:hypothetical protein